MFQNPIPLHIAGFTAWRALMGRPAIATGLWILHGEGALRMTGSRAHPEVSRIFRIPRPDETGASCSVYLAAPALTHALAHLDSTGTAPISLWASQSGNSEISVFSCPRAINGEVVSSRTLYVDGELPCQESSWHAEESAWEGPPVVTCFGRMEFPLRLSAT